MTVKELRQMLREWGRCHHRMKEVNYGPRRAGSCTAAACYVAKTIHEVGIMVRATNPVPEYQMPRHAKLISELVEELDHKCMTALQSKYLYPDEAQERFEKLTDSRKFGYWVKRAEKKLMEAVYN